MKYIEFHINPETQKAVNQAINDHRMDSRAIQCFIEKIGFGIEGVYGIHFKNKNSVVVTSILSKNSGKFNIEVTDTECAKAIFNYLISKNNFKLARVVLKYLDHYQSDK